MKPLIITTPNFDAAIEQNRDLAKGLVPIKTAEQRLQESRKTISEHYAKHGPAAEQALKAVNGRSKSFCITSMSELIDIAQKAEERLQKQGVTKRNRKGARVTYAPAGPSASSYKYPAKSTRIVLERNSNSWRLVEVTETSVYPRSGSTFQLTVSEAAAVDISNKAFAGIRVHHPEPKQKI